MVWIAIFIAAYFLLRNRPIYYTQQHEDIELIRDIYNTYRAEIDGASARFNIPVALIVAIIATESSGDKFAEGTVGERGLMQITKGALEDVNNAYDGTWKFSELWNPFVNIYVGTAYLRLLVVRWGDLQTAIWKYNGAKSYLDKVDKWYTIAKQLGY